MAFLQFLLVSQLALAAVVLSNPLSLAETASYHELEPHGPGTYAYGYDIDDPDTGNVQFRQEERHPNGTVTGSYGLLQPDGNVRVVHYIADKHGYRAKSELRHPKKRPAGPVLYPKYQANPKFVVPYPPLPAKVPVYEDVVLPTKVYVHDQ